MESGRVVVGGHGEFRLKELRDRGSGLLAYRYVPGGILTSADAPRNESTSGDALRRSSTISSPLTTMSH